jgi:hypothetical protein
VIAASGDHLDHFVEGRPGLSLNKFDNIGSRSLNQDICDESMQDSFMRPVKITVVALAISLFYSRSQRPIGAGAIHGADAWRPGSGRKLRELCEGNMPGSVDIERQQGLWSARL